MHACLGVHVCVLIWTVSTDKLNILKTVIYTGYFNSLLHSIHPNSSARGTRQTVLMGCWLLLIFKLLIFKQRQGIERGRY